MTPDTASALTAGAGWAYRPIVQLRTARVSIVGLLLVGGIAAPSALAKSAYYEILARCPCAGPSARVFWSGVDDRLRCVDQVLADLASQGWPQEVLARDRVREGKSRCGRVDRQCDGTPNRPCPRRMVCDVADANCRPEGATGICVSRKLRRKGCRLSPFPMCGCDGRTYASECRIRAAGVTLAHGNSCEHGCGGPDRIACPAGQTCYAAFGCDGADARGLCLNVDPRCGLTSEQPVCGCDDVTYASPCDAAAAGVALKRSEACAP